MNSAKSPPARRAYEEVSELIRTLRDTEQRLEQLTGGEVDAVTDRDGRTLVLRRAQDRLRYSEAARQAAILNALPAHIALVNVHGIFISLNKTWRRSTGANPIQGSGHAIGVDYLAICDSARGQGSAEAHKVAEGIRSVLSGQAKSFSLEYSYDSPTERRRFLLTVTPLADDHPSSAVVMHLDVTTHRQTEENLRASE